MASHSSFTPSDPQALEALFVARERLAQSLMASIRDSARTANKHQRLLVGPRGIGKTHLIALIYHRVRADAELCARLRIAWLPEDPYVPGYTQLLALILRRLCQDEPDLDWLDARLDAVLDLTDTGRQEAVLEALVAEALQHGGDARTLLLLAENLDDLLADLREDGQRKLRALIQNTSRISILATSTSLTDALTERDKTFYGFFRTQRLEPFGVTEAAALLARLAERAGDPSLADLIWSPLGLARVRAVHYLAGGNPRVYVIFHAFLTRESLDALVEPFMRLMDELTPYYQARMARLAPLQRGIIDALRRLRAAVPVKAIAREVMVSPQSVSTQLGKLVELGYVLQADSIGRSNYYELREPLMRLCLEVKEQRGRTIPLFIDFLRVWYSSRELAALAADAAGGTLEGAHLSEAAERARAEPNPLRSSLEQAFQRHMTKGDYGHALAEAECAIAREPDDKACWQRKAWCLEELDRPLEERLACWQRVTEIDSDDWLGWNEQGVILNQLGRFDETLSASARAVELGPDEPILNHNHSRNLQRAGRHAEARRSIERAMDLAGEPSSAADWHQRADDLRSLDRPDETLHAYRRTLELEPRRIETWGHLLGALQEQGRYRTIHRLAERIATLLPNIAILQGYLGIASGDLGDFDAASAAYERALDLDPDLDHNGKPVTLWRAAFLALAGRDGEARTLLARPRPAYGSSNAFRRELLHAETLLWLDRWDEGRAELDRLLAGTRPPTWAAENLINVRWLPARSQSPSVWRRHIELWIELFARHRLLPELGEVLVHSLRTLAIDWIAEPTARAWLETWQDIAGEIPELQLPLRLLAAGVAYAAERDQRALLALPREERGLLEPWLANLYRTEPDETDRELDALMATVERRLAADWEAERRAAFWREPAPDAGRINLDVLLVDYGTLPADHPRRLLPGPWRRLDRAEAVELLGRLIRSVPDVARALSRHDLRVVLIERRPLSFATLELAQIHVVEPDGTGAMDLLIGDGDAILIDGWSETLHAQVAAGHVRLDTPEAHSDYTRFFFTMLRDLRGNAEGGRFEVLDDGAGLAPTRAEPPTEVPALQPWRLDRSDADGRPVHVGTIAHAGALFRAELRLDPSNGHVDVVDDKPIASDLTLPRESFDGPLRRFPRTSVPGRRPSQAPE